MSATTFAGALSPAGCVARQARLKAALAAAELDAVLLGWRHHVYAFSGHWASPWHAPLLLVPACGPVVLVTGAEAEAAAVADIRAVYPSHHIATLRDHQPALALQALAPHLAGLGLIGCDHAVPALPEGAQRVEAGPLLLRQRRHKDADEVAALRWAIRGAEAAFAQAKSLLRPSVTELELHAHMHAAAVLATGEAIDPFGNDFQAGSPGGPPRPRPMRAGELLILDLGVQARGYRCDLSRTFAVDGRPTAAQQEAHRRVLAALDHVERSVRPGTSCRALYHEVAARLNDNPHGWTFPHHLGHGIGLFAHEAPRLNPHWDDLFEEGDVFTAEPGLYGEDLQAGIRLEQDYRVTRDGVERLSHFPLGLV